MKRLLQTHVEVKGKKVPAKIYMERRNNVRASIGKRAVILRMPYLMTEDQRKTQYSWFCGWVNQQFKNNKDLEVRFFGKGYADGDTLEVGKRIYQIKISFIDRKTHGAKLKNGVIHLLLAKHDTEAHLQKAIKHLLSRVVAQDYMPEISRRVNEINRLYFQRPIRSINFKYNHSNWGSCSVKGNVNLSTRLLFAPDDVVDYVIVHELAHLIEMNHSPRFWKIVEEVMPDYKEKEHWLKEYGNLCSF